jgi:hypothetical protein
LNAGDWVDRCCDCDGTSGKTPYERVNDSRCFGLLILFETNDAPLSVIVQKAKVEEPCKATGEGAPAMAPDFVNLPTCA